ncbi:MAG: GNAT family N-acetyltransferase [Candidatus Micrarchaeota archaeon]|nr:GNAT family N-acetyltransferase [Candidatus Micrarchaeota archaeon]
MGVETIKLSRRTSCEMEKWLAELLRKRKHSQHLYVNDTMTLRWVGETKLSKSGVKYVACVGNVYVGTIKMWEFELESLLRGFDGFGFKGARVPSAYIGNFAVEEEYRAMGFGTQILGSVERIALSEGMRYTLLHSEPKLSDFYMKRGYNLMDQETSFHGERLNFFQKEIAV